MNKYDRFKLQFNTDFLIDWEKYKDNYDSNITVRRF